MESKCILLGFPKCGQHTLLKDYKDIISREICWQEDALETYEKNYLKYRPVFIMRNVYDFLLSGYNYWDLDVKDFDEFLEYKPKTWNPNYFGIQNPIERCDWLRWMLPFKKYNPIIHDIADYEIHEHKTNKKKQSLTVAESQHINNLIANYHHDHTEAYNESINSQKP
jgi:hypothetical protein